MELKQRGYDVIFCPVDTSGRVIEKDFAEIVNENTSFISVMHVNNETGSVNDIKKLCSVCLKLHWRISRQKISNKHDLLTTLDILG